jgi:HAD superfamily hydrolase (TIGR01484 family)
MNAGWLLVTDLDGTIIPHGDAPEQSDAIELFRAAVIGDPDLVLMYVTGRHHELALAGICEHRLPLPKALGCDVGTALYWRDGENWRLDEDYRALMAQKLGKPRPVGAGWSEIDRLLEDVPDIHLQPAQRQSQFKRSYYISPAATSAAVLNRWRARLDENSWSLHLVASVDPAGGLGLLDCLPAGVDKSTCLEYVRQQLGAAPDRTVFAGDSGNDVAALLSGNLAIVMGNAPAAVKDTVRSEAKARDWLDRIHFAHSDCTAGVVDGMRRFGLIEDG